MMKLFDNRRDIARNTSYKDDAAPCFRRIRNKTQAVVHVHYTLKEKAIDDDYILLDLNKNMILLLNCFDSVDTS